MAGKVVIAGPKLQQGLMNVVQNAGGSGATFKNAQTPIKQGILTTTQEIGTAGQTNNYTGYFKVVLNYETTKTSDGDSEQKPYLLVIDGHNPDYITEKYPCGYISHNNVIDEVPVTRIDGNKLDLDAPTDQWVCLEVRRYSPNIWFQIKLMKEDEIINVGEAINFRKLAVIHKVKDEKTGEVTIRQLEQILETESPLSYDMHEYYFRLVADEDVGEDSLFYTTRKWHIRDGHSPNESDGNAGYIQDVDYLRTQGIKCEDIEIADDGATYVYLQYDVSSYPFVTEYLTSSEELVNSGNLKYERYVFLQQLAYFYCEDNKITYFSQNSIGMLSLYRNEYYAETPGFCLIAKYIQDEEKKTKVKTGYRINSGKVTFGANVVLVNGVDDAKPGTYFLVSDCSEGHLSSQIVYSETGNYSADNDTTDVDELGEIITDEDNVPQRASWYAGDRTITWRWY